MGACRASPLRRVDAVQNPLSHLQGVRWLPRTHHSARTEVPHAQSGDGLSQSQSTIYVIVANRAVSQKEHGYHGGHCYLPLYIFCGRHLLAAKLRRVNTDASAGSVEELERMATQIRRHWPEVCCAFRRS